MARARRYCSAEREARRTIAEGYAKVGMSQAEDAHWPILERASRKRTPQRSCHPKALM